MPNTKSARRALKKSLVRRQHNRARKSMMRTAVKKVLKAVAEGDAATAEALLPQAYKMIDKNAKWNQIHANTAARRKSQLARAVASLKAGS